MKPPEKAHFIISATFHVSTGCTVRNVGRTPINPKNEESAQDRAGKTV